MLLHGEVLDGGLKAGDLMVVWSVRDRWVAPIFNKTTRTKNKRGQDLTIERLVHYVRQRDAAARKLQRLWGLATV